MASELATAYVSIALSTKGLGKGIVAELGNAGDKAGSGAGKRAGKSFTSAIGATMARVGKVGLIAAGAAAAGVLFGGFKAAIGQQQSEKVLSGLYGDANLAKTTLKGLGDVAKKSPLDYSGYAAAANTLAYAGVQGQKTVDILKNVGLAITASGGDSSNLNSASDAVLKMVNAGKVQLDTLQQLSNSGVPILSGLASHFGKSISDVNAMASAGSIDLQDVLDVMQNAEGDTFKKMKVAGKEASGSFSNQWKIAKDNVSQAIGKTLLPLIESITPVIKKVADFISDKLVPAVSGFFGWLKHNKATVLTFVGIIGTAVGIVAAWTAAQWLLNAALTANPIGIVVVAIAALAAGFVYLWNHSEGFRDFWIGLWNGVKAAVSTAVDGILAAWDWVVGVFNGAVSWVAGVGSDIGGAFKTAFGFIHDYIIDPVKTAWDWIVQRFNDAKTWFGGIIDGIKAHLKEQWDLIETIFVKPIRAAWDWIYKRFSDALGWIGGVASSIGSALKTAWDWVYKYLIDPITEAWAAVSAAFVTVAGWIGARVDDITAAARKAWGFIVTYIVQPVASAWAAVESAFKTVAGWVGARIDDILWALRKAWNFVSHYIVGPITSAWDAVSSAFQAAVGWVGDRIADVADALKWAWDKVYEYLIGPVGRAIGWIKDQIDDLKDWMSKQDMTSPSSWLFHDPLTNIVPKPFSGGKGFGGGGYFGDGGVLTSGWNVVGDRGPELTHTEAGKTRVFSNTDSQPMMGSAGPTINQYNTINYPQGTPPAMATNKQLAAAASMVGHL